MDRSVKWWLMGWAGAAAFFRMPGLFANHFHPDEALFASFARTVAVWRDPLLQIQPIDKPPLLFYIQALFYPLFGPVEFAARLPNLIVSILLVPLVGMLAWRFYGNGLTAVITSAILACLPLSIQFSSTAFLDPFMTFWLAAALAALVYRKPAWSGFFFGLAVVTKYQTWLFLPLLLGIGWLRGWRWPAWRRWLAGGLPIGLLLAAWGWARAGDSSLWAVQMANFGGVRLSWSWELWQRGLDWLQAVGLAVGSTWVGVIMFLLILAAGIRAWGSGDRKASLTQLLILYIAGYLILHWLLAIPVWDRYLLPLMPLVAVLVAHQLALFSRQISIRGIRFAAAGILSVLLLVGAWGARHGRYPIGGQPGADQGASVVASALADAPYGTVLYDHWFSWQWRYHLFDKKVHVSWFPHPEALATELAVFGDNGQPHYLALPDSDQALPVRRAVTAAGFRLQPVALSAPASIKLFEIIR